MTDITFDDVRPEIKKFAVEMEEKLRANDFKTHWSECDYEYLVQLYMMSVERVSDVINCAHNRYSIYDDPFMKSHAFVAYRAIDYLIDVANYSMMLYDKIQKQGDEFTEKVEEHFEHVNGDKRLL